MALDIDQLKKFIRLLGSPIAGEALAALAAIEKTLKREKLDWNDFAEMIAAPIGRPQVTLRHKEEGFTFKRPPASPSRDKGDHFKKARPELRGRLAALMAFYNVMKAEERDFVGSLSIQKYPLTERQEAWLTKIEKRLNHNVAGANPGFRMKWS